MRLPDEPDIPAQINIVPMIDVIFAILTFFIMSSLYLTRFNSLPVNLPQAGTTQAGPPPQITVTIDAQGQIFLNQQKINLEQLPEEVKSQRKPSQPLIVVINADKSVNHGQVVGVMDQIRQVEGVKLAIATKK
ncbi:biopolymer transporter ExbD [Cylindrospermopsis raciborskii S07]|uniref:Biopolymer transporter ExbD n=4 Tax=Cylindrospermopsis TaxID=77021 RepID=A0A7H0F024_9CYAN|nr:MULTISPECIES: biopolymer transporter ExbD [Cylindrospermopsis]EFA70519.1 Biopolymer transport protein ExbD/TolR [Cylindrospermopsis raciborskii CS-505]MBA4447175.1 biopolymer transporter ExbD [Cylindrospermopsis raciborskii CS-506_C]MBA4451451.1 biopolymer transporter ExbD [Cylindrospermopsis raciborskii CS-506_D]MBA4458034.1 biopolymer transporter ExbD [Cylindrospermopsis raciborskii CS-506_B]MBA4467425.1 biopolymer transporter ExbD [Cylindrospermopsis raciborskii CS-506_A]